MELDFLITSFVALFVIIDPIGITPIFVAITQGMDKKLRQKIAIRAIAVSGFVISLFILFGETVLGFIGISMAAFRVAGGILLFLTALDMLFQRRSKRRENQTEDKIVVPEGEEARKVAAQTMRDAFKENDGRDYSDKSDAEMLDAIVYNVFTNFSPWGGFPRNLVYRFRPNGNRHDSSIMEAIFLQRNHIDPEKQEPYEPIPIHYLSEDENWDDAEELTGIGFIFDQDMANIPELEAGMRASKKGAVTYADYQESRLRHYHQTIDKYIAKGPLKP